jgi:hypothetical protein
MMMQVKKLLQQRRCIRINHTCSFQSTWTPTSTVTQPAVRIMNRRNIHASVQLLDALDMKDTFARRHCTCFQHVYIMCT